jgi:hypothetical protein
MKMTSQVVKDLKGKMPEELRITLANDLCDIMERGMDDEHRGWWLGIDGREDFMQKCDVHTTRDL